MIKIITRRNLNGCFTFVEGEKESMNSSRTFIHFSIIFSLVIVMLFSPLSYQKAIASYTYVDNSTSTPILGGGVKVFDHHMVWYSIDTKRNPQIFYRELISAEKVQVTDSPSPKESPNIGVSTAGEPYIVWADKRNYDSNAMLWDIYIYNVATKKEKKISSKTGQLVSPSIHGDYVVWHDLTKKEMYLYDLVNNQERSIGKGGYPKVHDGKVLFGNTSDGGLSLYDIQKNETKKVVELPNNEYVYTYAFNGEIAVWAKTNFDREVTYSMADTTQSNVNIIDLTSPTKQTAQYSQIVIGEKYAAWLIDKNGTAQIVGADIKNQQVQQMTNSTVDQSIYSFYGDKLIVKGNDGNLIYRTIKPTETPPPNGSKDEQTNEPKSEFENNTGSKDEQTSKPKNEVVKNIGSNGGFIEMEGVVRLNIPEGTFKEETRVSILPSKLSNQSKMIPLSSPWEITSKAPFNKEVELVINYNQENVIPQQLKKIGIYCYDLQKASWEYVGGIYDTKTHSIKGNINNTGTYAAMLYEKTFTDIQKHWAQPQIEVLASRWIINGINETQYGPNQKITRAQFIKMLARALDLKPVKSERATFHDVSESHWSYEWVEAAYQTGIILGDQGKFKPNEVVTREAMMTMIMRAMAQDIEMEKSTTNSLSNYKDGNKVSSWAKPYIELAIQQGLLEGSNGQLKPSEASTRAMAAVVLYRFLEKAKNDREGVQE